MMKSVRHFIRRSRDISWRPVLSLRTLPFSVPLLHHRRYLVACDRVGIPVKRSVRAQMMAEGTELLAHGETLAEWVRGAERELASIFHGHLAAVLLGHVSRRLDFRDFVTRRDVSGTLDSKYEDAVADELRHRYSDRPQGDQASAQPILERWTRKSLR
jgi:hypothetical protein